MKMLNNLFFIFALSISLNANSILTQYRQNGLENIEKQLDFELTKIKYWDEYLKNIDTTFGYTESYSSILTCNKNNSSLSVYKKNKNKEFTLLKKYDAFTGEKEGDKQIEGDLKTPLGIYSITKKISKLDSFYGPLALVTSYPNTYDKFQGKSGSGIWIHGLPTQQKRDNYTKGCIAIENSDIQCLGKNISIDKTVLIISEAQTNKSISKNTFSQLLSSLFQWRYSWVYNDIEKYLSFYSNDFIRNDGMKYLEFVQYKTRVFNKEEKKKIIFNNINIIPYPNQKNIFQITFHELYETLSYKFEGDKVLIVQLTEKNNLKILTEK